MNRRQFLRSAGSCSVLVAGCAESNQPRDETSTDLCQGDIERIGVSETVKDGPIGGFELTIANDAVPMGGEITAHLENVTDETLASGNDRKYLIERETEDGWQSIFWEAKRETAGWNDEAVRHAPGEGFTWELRFTRSGLEEGWYHVCEPLDAGAYRFVYFGVDGGSLAARFTVTEN